MLRRMHARRTVAFLALLIALFAAAAASAQEVRVVTSGGFTEAYKQLAPRFERDTRIKVISGFGASMGATPDAIPNRLKRGEPIDVIILASPGLETFKRTLLAAKSIGSSDSASGVYLRSELFPRLGVADQIRNKSKVIEAFERVGDAVARGDVEIGFQQVSELKPVPGITIVGPLPEGAQQVTIFSAAIPKGAKNAEAAGRLIQFLSSPAVAPVVEQTGLEPIRRQGGPERPSASVLTG